MAAGAGGSAGSMESTLDRKFQAVSNTMESIQGLSTWCIDNKKYHSLIVRYWMKWLRKSDAAHRLNLFYLANDVIQNCKRKNAIVYRTAFAEVLSEAFLLVNSDGDSKVMKAVERILGIWEERNVYSGVLITELRGYLVKEESPPETPVEQKTPVDSKAALKSKIVAEFVPQALVDQLSKYKRSLEEVELREKQLAAMRVDVCSSDTLKKLKDKAGGKKFSKDFEEGNVKLQDFVKFLDRQSKGGPLLLEALSNADIFYEMQYQEVKIVANAYQTFANRVSHLKRKLDSLKTTLPDLDESPIPSPSADAPSPTGSESPFRGLEMSVPDPDLDGSAMDDEAEPPAPSPLSSPGGSPKHVFTVGENDNREVEDMELSEDEAESGGILVEERVECPVPTAVADPAPAKIQPSLATDPLPTTQAHPSSAAPPASLASVDLSKIGSLLNSLTSVMKNTGPTVESPATPASSSSSSTVKTTPPASGASQDASSLVSLLSQVDMTPEGLLGALSKAQGQGSSLQGLTSLLSNPVGKTSSDSSSTGKLPPLSSTPASAAPSISQPLSSATPVPSPPVSTLKQSPSAQREAPLSTPNAASALVQALHRDMELPAEPEPSLSSKSLESKIHSFLQGNPGFNAFNLGIDSAAGGANLSPLTGTDTRDGTPVRDEGGGTPTQDEIMDKPVADQLTSSTHKSSAVEMVTKATEVRLSPAAYQNSTWQDPHNPPQHAHLPPGVAQNGQGYQSYPYGSQERTRHGIAHYQEITAQGAGPVPREGVLGTAGGNKTVEGFQGLGGGGWYGSTYQKEGPEGRARHPRGHSMAAPGGGEEHQTSGLYQYQADQTREPQGPASHQGTAASSGFFEVNLPPVPQLPPPPEGFETPLSMAPGEMIPPQQQPVPNPEMEGVAGARVDSVIGGMVIHDHQHKSMFHHDDRLYNPDNLHRHLDDLHPHPDDMRYQEEHRHYHEDPHHHDALLHPDDPRWHPDDPYYHPDDPHYQAGSPPHRYSRGRGRLTPPLSPSEGAFYDYYPHGSSPPHHPQRRALPPHPEMHHPGPRPLHRPPLRPPLRPPHPAHHPHPRGLPRGPPFPPFHGPDPWLRGKRPGPRGGGPGGPVFIPKRPFLPPRY
ncbi:regulation of nuclear pre-mRNA domain-containing protein 2a isoform 1-T2 [Polymixia lowei]